VSDGLPVLFFVLVGLAIAGVAYWQWQARKRRLEGFLLVSQQLGLRYSHEDPFGILAEPFALFREGDGRGIEHVLDGTYRDVPIRAFDYWYFDESTDSKGNRSRSYSYFSCALMPLEAGCFRLSISPESVFTRLADALTFRDIEFESEEFNRAWNVTSDDAGFAHAFVDARMCAWLLANGGPHAFEVVGDRILVARRRIDPRTYPAMLDAAVTFRAQVPKVVFDLYPRSG
jgi:hypothetical protein